MSYTVHEGKSLAQIFELEPSPDAEDHLWEHGLYIEDAYDVLDEDRYKLFSDAPHDDRVKIVGPDRGGRLLTFVVTRPDGQGRCLIVTGWPADAEEQTIYSRPGGTQHG